MNTRGILRQRQEGYDVVRLPTDGRITSEQFKKLAEVAGRAGKGFAVLTMRKGVELPWIGEKHLGDVLGELGDSGMVPGSSGKGVRSIVNCAGQERCPFYRSEVGGLAEEIGARYRGRGMPEKFTITLCGCPNYCSHPYLNDVGIIGRARPRINPDKCIGCGQCVRLCRGDASGALEQDATDPPVIDYERCIECGWCITNCPTGAIEAEKAGCTIMVGGRGGAKPRLAVEIAKIASEDETLALLERIFQYMKEHSNQGERLGDVIDRKGLEHFEVYVLRAIVAVITDGGDVR